MTEGWGPLMGDTSDVLRGAGAVIAPAPPRNGSEPFSREWWVARLDARLDAREERMRRFVDYYDGRHSIKLVSERFREEFGRRFPEYADNFMPLVVDSENRRLHVQGVRYGRDPKGDPDAWEWWQRNHLDADAPLAHKDALIKGVCNVMVWRDPDARYPVVTIEDAMQTVVDTVPGRRWERRAAFKRWMDDDGHMLAELYLPDRVWRFRTRDKEGNATRRVWDPTEWGGAGDVLNPIGAVPIVPLVNRPSLSRIRGGVLSPDDDGESELAAVIANQDYINAYRMQAMVASEFASFRQRWVLNLELPTDPVTGRPVQPFKPGVDRLWTFPPPDPEEYPDASKAPKTEVGEFDQTDTSGLRDLIQEELKHLATKGQMPYHFILESWSVAPSGESIKSAEASFVMKVEDAQTNFGEAWEEVFRLKYLWEGDARSEVVDAEVFWRDAESRAEAVLTDAMVKARSFGVANEILQERWGMSPQEIERNRTLTASSPVVGRPGGDDGA